ncbi:MAG: hypothetical protein H6529_04705 [Nocardioides sp.]|nr:hypothetical protein [Nocardioides sp.]
MSVRAGALLVVALSVSLSASLSVSLSVQAARPSVARVEAVDTWGPVHRFEGAPRGESVAAGPDGSATVAWGSQRGWPEPVKVARRTPTGRWSPPATLGEGFAPVVAADPLGNLTVAWCRERNGFTTGVWVARKPAGRPWTRPVHVSRDRKAPGYPDGWTSYGAAGLDVAVTAAGAAVVTWEWGGPDRGVPSRIQAVRRAPHGRWGPVETVSSTVGGESTGAQVAVARNGTAWVAYDRSPVTGPTGVVVRSRSAAGTWSPAARVDTGELGDLGVSTRGDVTVVLLHRGRVRVAVLPRGRAWQPPVAVTPRDVRVTDWSVALSPRGAVLVGYLWRDDRVDVVRRAFGGSWTAPVTVADPVAPVYEVFTAVDARGDMFTGWSDHYGIWSRYRPTGKGWRAETTAQRGGGVEVLEGVRSQVLPGGDVVLLWAQEGKPLRARVLDVQVGDRIER